MRETPAEHEPDPALQGIHAGELAAISLGMALKADLLLMDDRKGVILARSKGLRVTGTLGILKLAARNGLTDLALAIAPAPNELSQPGHIARRPAQTAFLLS